MNLCWRLLGVINIVAQIIQRPADQRGTFDAFNLKGHHIRQTE